MKTIWIPSIKIEKFRRLLDKYTNRRIIQREPYIYDKRCYLRLTISTKKT